jgi:hypothetical protein
MSLITKYTYYVSGKKKESIFSKIKRNCIRFLRRRGKRDSTCLDSEELNPEINEIDEIKKEVSFGETVRVVGGNKKISFKRLKVDDDLPSKKRKVFHLSDCISKKYLLTSKKLIDNTHHYYTEVDNSTIEVNVEVKGNLTLDNLI